MVDAGLEGFPLKRFQKLGGAWVYWVPLQIFEREERELVDLANCYILFGKKM